MNVSPTIIRIQRACLELWCDTLFIAILKMSASRTLSNRSKTEPHRLLCLRSTCPRRLLDRLFVSQSQQPHSHRKQTMTDDAQTDKREGDRGSYLYILMINCSSHQNRETQVTWPAETTINHGSGVGTDSEIGDSDVLNTVEREEKQEGLESIRLSTKASRSAAIKNVKDRSDSVANVCPFTHLRASTKPLCQPADDLKEDQKTRAHLLVKLIFLPDGEGNSRSFPTATLASRKYSKHSVRHREQYHRQQHASILSRRTRRRRKLPLEEAVERCVRRARLQEERYQRLTLAVVRARKIRKQRMSESFSVGSSLQPIQVSYSSQDLYF
jgi:hypothetical protein